jgi:hypothetical protein
MDDIPLHASYASVARDTELGTGGLLHNLLQQEWRRARNTDSTIEAAQTSNDDEGKTSPNCLGSLHSRILHFSVVTRYMVYVAPLALLLAIPIVLSQTKVVKGSIGGTDQQRFWIWIEIGECSRQPCIGRR